MTAFADISKEGLPKSEIWVNIKSLAFAKDYQYH